MTNPSEQPSSQSAVLEVNAASRRWGTNVALNAVSFSVGAGEIFALIGPNGAGKTTLVRSITGRVPLHEGHITLLGQPAGRASRMRRHLGLVPQAIALYSHLTARENLAVFARLAGMARDQIPSAVDRALQRVDLTTRADDRTAHLSGGMQRRLNIAAGTLHEPTLLLLDEPTVGLDVAAREAVHDVLRVLRRAGIAILLTTHDLDQAQELADNVGVLSHGRLLAVDAPNALIQTTFGDAQELVVILGASPTAEARRYLEDNGLRGVNGGKVWSGLLTGGLTDVSAVSQRLKALGIGVEELRVREPSLRSVFVRLTGENMAP